MQQATNKIDNKLSGDKSDYDGGRSNMIIESGLDKFPPKIKSKAHVSAFEGTLGIGVVIIPKILFLEWRITVGEGCLCGYGHKNNIINQIDNATI